MEAEIGLYEHAALKDAFGRIGSEHEAIESSQVRGLRGAEGRVRSGLGTVSAIGRRGGAFTRPRVRIEVAL